VGFGFASKKKHITELKKKKKSFVICDPSPIQPRYFGFLTLGNQWVGEFEGAKS
jgi:hypothetical protein